VGGYGRAQRHGGAVTLGRDKVRAIYLDPTPIPGPPPRGRVHDALDALKGLQATNGNLTAFGDSTARLSEARTAVARYLESLGPPEAGAKNGVRDAVAAAFQYLSLALIASKPLTDSQLVAIGQDPALDTCPHLQDVLQRDLGRFKSPEVSRNRGVAVSMFGITELWTCASEKIVEAERLLKGEE
jgi:hypothetical protein